MRGCGGDCWSCDYSLRAALCSKHSCKQQDPRILFTYLQTHRHSLGGAVAQLCTLRLLHALWSTAPPPAALRCIVFGAPPIGNAALADHVQREGWEPHFLSVALPGGQGKLGASALIGP